MRHGLAFVAAAAVYLTGVLHPLEHMLEDARFQLLTREASEELLLVEIDAESLRELPLWPWPREYHAVVLERLVAAGARRVGFDISFAAASNSKADARFAQALAGAEDVVLAAVAQKASGRADGEEVIFTEPLPILKRHATLGSINVHPESDSLIRRMPTREPWQDGSMPALAAVLADREDAPFSSFYVDFGLDLSAMPRLSYADVLAGRFEPSLVDGKVVLIGATATALGDNMPVPLFQSIPGVLLQARAFHSLVQDRALQRVAPVSALLPALICTLLLGSRFAGWPWQRGLAAFLLASAGVWLLAVAVQYVTPVLLDTTPSILSLALSYAAALVGRIDQQARHLLLQRRSLRKVVDASFDGVLSFEENGVLRALNPAAELIFRCRAEKVVGGAVERLLPELGKGELRPCMLHETPGRRSDGSEFPAEVAVSEVAGENGRLLTAFVRDVTERKAQEALAHQATHDALTGLPNRALLVDRLEQALAVAKRTRQSFSLLLLDLDRFKEINDTLGHHIGDLLLKQVGERLQAALRETDTVARLGGDEFAALLPSATDLDTACEIANRIVEALGTPFQLESFALEVGTSIGVAVFPDHGGSRPELLQRADVAMYTAKKGHVGFAIYDPKDDPNSVRQLMLSSDLRRAIEQEELVLHYQPKVELASGRTCGAEALVRWQHPQHGFLAPAEFIPIAERTGLVRPLTIWALGDALRRGAGWAQAGADIDVAINLSVKSLRDQELPDALEALARSCGLKPERVTLEITESAVMSDPKRAQEVLERLRDLGVRLSIDDFGTGYSSLAYLKRLPVSELKIDRSFISGMLDDENDAVIVRSIVELGHNLGLKVIAEGVESEEVLDRLTALGCDVAQGFLLARPLPPEEFAAWLGQQRHALQPTQEPAGASGSCKTPTMAAYGAHHRHCLWSTETPHSTLSPRGMDPGR